MEDLKDPMERAVLQLTKIVRKLSKPQTKQHQDLDALLDQAPSSSASSEPSLGASRRSNAAALRILTKAFEESPRMIFESVEMQMRKDFGQVPAGFQLR